MRKMTSITGTTHSQATISGLFVRAPIDSANGRSNHNKVEIMMVEKQARKKAKKVDKDGKRVGLPPAREKALKDQHG